MNVFDGWTHKHIACACRTIKDQVRIELMGDMEAAPIYKPLHVAAVYCIGRTAVDAFIAQTGPWLDS